MLVLGLGEILVICLVVLLVIGPDQLPQFLRSAGQMYGKIRRTSEELRRAFTSELDRSEAEERFQKLQERRKQAEEDRKKAMESAGGIARPVLKPTPADPEKKLEPGQVFLDDDPETPAVRPEPRPTPLPPGVSPEEWQRLPPDMQDLLRRVADQGKP